LLAAQPSRLVLSSNQPAKQRLAVSTWKQYASNLRQFPPLIFDTSALRNLFLKWGSLLSIQQLRTKLLVMLCVLGALRVASTILPKFNQVTIITTANHHVLSVPIVSYKNNLYGDGNHVTLHKSSNKLCCPVIFDVNETDTDHLSKSTL